MSQMLSQFVEYVYPAEVTAADWRWLALADEAGPAFQQLPAERIQRELLLGTMHLFRTRPCPGVFLVEVRLGATGLKRLGIVRAAGRGLSWLGKPLAELLQHTAREWGCEQIETMIYNKRLALALTRLGAKPEAVNMVLEVGDGD